MSSLPLLLVTSHMMQLEVFFVLTLFPFSWLMVTLVSRPHLWVAAVMFLPPRWVDAERTH